MSKIPLLALTVALLGAPSAIASSTVAACPWPCASECELPCEPCDAPCATDANVTTASR